MSEEDLLNRQIRQCWRKKMVDTREEAQAEARRLHKKFKAKFNFYECPFCGCWHTGRERSDEAAKRRWHRNYGSSA